MKITLPPAVCITDMLGSRLEESSDPGLSHNAVLCYICSGNVAKFVDCWEKRVPEAKRGSSEVLQVRTMGIIVHLYIFFENVFF